MKLIEVDPSTVVENPVIAARKGAPNKAKIKKFAENFLERREAGRPHQIQPGVSRIGDDDVVEVIIGHHRLYGARLLNSQLGPDDEPYLFSTIVVPSTDKQALIDAITENEWRVAANAVDKAEAMQKLIDMGLTREEVAKTYGCAVSWVGDLLRIAKLNNKVIDLYLKGKITESALTDIARYEGDETLQEDFLAIAEQEKEARVAAVNLAQARAKEDDTPSSDKPKTKTKGTAPVSEAVKGKKKPSTKAPSDKVTSDDVKKAAERTGKKAKAPGKDTRNTKELRVFLASSFGSEVTEELPAPAVELANKLVDWLDKDVGDRGLRDCFLRCCTGGAKAAK